MTQRVPTVLEDDSLLSAAQCCRKLGGLHSDNWPKYAARWDSLAEGARIVRVKPNGRGRMRWLRSAVVFHIREELKRGRPNLERTHDDVWALAERHAKAGAA